MYTPDVHRDYQRDRHADLLREARSGELASRIAESRRAERQSLLERLFRARHSGRPATSH